MFNSDYTMRLIKICDGETEPQSIEELCCYQSYSMKMEGESILNMAKKVDPKLSEMNLQETRHFLLGLAFAEDDLIGYNKEKNGNIH